MKWIHVKALFESDNVSFGEEMVSDIFFSLGLTGVVCQVPLDDPPEGFGSDALPVSDECSVSGYIPNTGSSIETLKEITTKAKELEKLSIKVVIETQVVDQEDWAESWKSFFNVIRVTDKIVIKPAWREFTQEIGDIVIELDPGMAFGTGTHPTTSMCLSLIEKYLCPKDRFLDVGAGSGILMVAAAKLGASHIFGVDIDEVAVFVSTENLIKNQISPELFDIKIGTLDNFKNLQFDLISANIIAEVLIEIMPTIYDNLKKGGVAILSGIIKDREPLIEKSLKENNFETLEIKSDGEWLAIAAKKQD